MSWLADRSMRVKVLLPVLVATAGIAGLASYGVAQLAAVGARSQAMYASIAKPMADLSIVRDMEGDTRVEVRDAVLLPPGEEQDGVIGEMRETDTTMDGALDAYVADHGGVTGKRATLLAQGRAGIAQWRQVRDNQLVPLARGNRKGAAAALLADGGGLAKADDTLAEALDQLADVEMATAEEVAAANRTSERRTRTVMALVSVAAIGVAVLVGMLVAGIIAGPLRRVQQVLTGLADGDLAGDPRVNSRDELGRMAGALVSATAALRRTVGSITTSAGALGDVAERLGANSERIRHHVAESVQRTELVSATTGNASRSIHAITAGATQMSTAINEIAQRATQAATVAGEAVNVVTGTSTTVAELGRTSADIEQVLKVITSIASQTNLLALNATIEAARAGEAGKGFAVVAGEVKDLAQQTATATGDIAERVAAIQSTSAEVTAAIERIGEVIREINDHQSAIAAAVEQQTATTEEMQRGVADAAQASERIAATVTGVAATARDTEGEVEQIRTVVADVSQLSEDLRTSVGYFRS